MVSQTQLQAPSHAGLAARSDPIETMRALAVILLVSFHVIGSGPGSGLTLDYPHPLRLFADGLIDLRMPLFAFIAGYVYALRPVLRGHYRGFVLGKIQRLYVPGLVAALIFACLSTGMGTAFARDAGDLWQIAVLPYAHFWFLQAILVIFAGLGLFEWITGGRYVPALFGLSLGLYLLMPGLAVNVMSVNAAFYLLPYLLLGLLCARHGDVVAHWAGPILLLAGLGVAVAGAMNILHYLETGAFSVERRDGQSLMLGLGLAALLFLVLPRFPQIETLGPFAFTIYLYHVIFTAGTREMLEVAGIAPVQLVFVTGLAAGLFGPVLLHLAAERHPVTRRYMLGLKS